MLKQGTISYYKASCDPIEIYPLWISIEGKSYIAHYAVWFN